jgi:hypothetical protein
MSAALFYFCIAAGSLGQVEEVPSLSPEDRKEQLRFFKEQVGELTLLKGDAAGEPFPLAPEPVLRYSNAERDIGSLDGAAFLWLSGARPIAAVSYSIRRLRNEAYRECTSFSGSPLVCRKGEQPVWAPKTGGLLAQKLVDAPAPAAGKVQRLTQMRELARRFAADTFNPRTDDTTQLRLLTQPLYRFADEKLEVIDGGLFAFVVSNDPELFLLLEAVGSTDKALWQYSLARMSSQKLVIRLDDKEVWSTTNYWQDKSDDRRTGPYVEARTGTFPNISTPAP